MSISGTTLLTYIEQILDIVPIQDLMLIMCDPFGEEILLVYLNQVPQLPVAEKKLNSLTLKTCVLEELKLDQIKYYSGFIAGYSALKILFPELLFHGIRFKDLDDILLEREHTIRIRQRQKEVYAAMYRLALHLYVNWESWAEEKKASLQSKVISEVIKLATPFLFYNQDLDGVVAIIPGNNLFDFLNMQVNGYTRIDLENPQFNSDAAPNLSGKWIIGLESDELNMIFPKSKFEFNQWIDLRMLLRRIGATQTEFETYHKSAWKCYQNWQNTGDNKFLRSAFMLEAGSRLMGENVSDLVGFLPAEDFELFSQQGRALKIYRTHSYRRPGGRHDGTEITLERLITEGNIPDGYNSYPFTFNILFRVIAGFLSKENILDLGSLLWKAGKGKELARTLWLLSQDAQAGTNFEWLVIGPQPGDRVDMALRATILHSLSKPWMWGTTEFYEDNLEKNYLNLNDCLLTDQQLINNHEKNAKLDAIKHWFGCFFDQTVVQRELSNLAQIDMQNEQLDTDSKLASTIWTDIPNLVRVSERLLGWYSADSSFAQAHSEYKSLDRVSDYLKVVADSQCSIEIPSPLFLDFYQQYLFLHDRWYESQLAIGSEIRSAPEELESLLVDFEKLEAETLVPSHEAKILNWVYQEDIQAIKHTLQTSTQGPDLQLILRNPYAIRGLQEVFHFDIQNQGSRTANKVELQMQRSSEFKLYSNVIQKVDHLLPGEHRRVSWEIQPESLEMAMTLNVQCSYHNQKHNLFTQNMNVTVKVTSPSENTYKPTKQPYVAGKPATGNGFFGRRNSIDLLILRMISGNITYIISPRRSGKTSLLLKLREILKYPEERERYNLGAERAAQISMYKPILARLQTIPTSDPRPAATFFKQLYQEICLELNLPYLEDQILSDFDRDPVYAFEGYIRKIFEKFPNIHLVIMVDEWDEIYRKEFSNLGSNLRSVMSFEPRISWIFTSTWGTIREMKQPGSPLHNLLVTLQVGPLQEPDARSLIIEPSKSANVNWTGEAIIAAMDAAGNWPYLIQLICFYVIEQLIKKPQKIVDPALVNLVVTQIIKEVKDIELYFGYLWEIEEQNANDNIFEPMSWMGRLLLWCLSNHDQPISLIQIKDWIFKKFREHGKNLPEENIYFDAQLNDELRRLKEVYGAIRTEMRIQDVDENQDLSKKETFYMISVPMIQNWLKQIIPPTAELLKLAYPGLMDELDKREKGFRERKRMN